MRRTLCEDKGEFITEERWVDKGRVIVLLRKRNPSPGDSLDETVMGLPGSIDDILDMLQKRARILERKTAKS